jgi:hypothetical protein
LVGARVDRKVVELVKSLVVQKEVAMVAQLVTLLDLTLADWLDFQLVVLTVGPMVAGRVEKMVGHLVSMLVGNSDELVVESLVAGLALRRVDHWVVYLAMMKAVLLDMKWADAMDFGTVGLWGKWLVV